MGVGRRYKEEKPFLGIRVRQLMEDSQAGGLHRGTVAPKIKGGDIWGAHISSSASGKYVRKDWREKSDSPESERAVGIQNQQQRLL